MVGRARLARGQDRSHSGALCGARLAAGGRGRGGGSQCPVHAEPAWIVHWLVGDGAATNEAAAKIVLATIRRRPLPRELVYLLVVVKCANHQANLTVASIVAGRAATVAADSASCWGDARKSVCGAVVRLFKFLVSDYEQEFLANLQELVVRRLNARPASSAAALESQRQRSLNLRSLYGEGVIPDDVLRICNGGVPEWRHLAEVGGAIPPGYMEGVRDDLVRALRKRILVVDESPTLSRMLPSASTSTVCFCCVCFGSCRSCFRCAARSPGERTGNACAGSALSWLGPTPTSTCVARACPCKLRRM